MIKKIIIGNKEYTMKASAYTQFAYRDLTGRSLLKDLQNFQGINTDEVNTIDILSETLLDIAFVLANEGNPTEVSNKIDFIKGIDNLFDNPKWIEEVVTLAASPLYTGKN